MTRTVCTVMLCLAVAVAAAETTVSIAVTPSPARQGDCLLVLVQAEESPAPECQWEGKSYPLYRVGDAYRAILPVPPDTPPGPRKLEIVLRDDAGAVTRTTGKVTVVKRAFGVQKLRMKRETSRVYDDPSVKQEAPTIHTGLAQTADEQLWQGPFAWPVKARVSTGFGLARTINGRIQYRHRGLDLAAPAGTKVFAPARGVVRLVRGDFKLHGKTIVLDHGQGVGSVYLHLSEICVIEGQRVNRGERIGKVGMTGAATGPHLHWGVYVSGEAVEPQFWINLPQGCR